MITAPYSTVTPAYGRDYKSAEAAQSAFISGKDFQRQPSGQYCSIKDFMAGCRVTIRYSSLRKVTTVNIQTA